MAIQFMFPRKCYAPKLWGYGCQNLAHLGPLVFHQKNLSSTKF